MGDHMKATIMRTGIKICGAVATATFALAVNQASANSNSGDSAELEQNTDTSNEVSLNVTNEQIERAHHELNQVLKEAQPLPSGDYENVSLKNSEVVTAPNTGAETPPVQNAYQ